MNYNFISGSTVDNTIPMVIKALTSGMSYMGFARSKPIWGLASLVYIEHNNTQTWPNTVIASTEFGDIDGSSQIKFFDKNSVELIGSTLTDFYREIFIVYSDNETDFDLTGYTALDNSTMSGGDGKLYLNYINESWAQIENLTPYYYEHIKIDLVNNPNRKYYILNYTGTNVSNAIKISTKTFSEVPSYVTDVCLFMQNMVSGEQTLINKNLKRSINILGESLVSGLIDPGSPDYSLYEGNDNYYLKYVNAQQKALMMSSDIKFVLRDPIGTVIIDEMKFVAPNPDLNAPILWETQSEKYLMLSYRAPNGETVYQKFKIGPAFLDEIGIWNESLPFNSANPVDDSNPAGLDISYLKNPAINRSIFGVEGLIKINPNEITFVRDIKNTEDRIKYTQLGFTIEDIDLTGETSSHIGTVKSNIVSGSYFIPLYDEHNFVVGDQLLMDQVTFTIAAVDYSVNSASITLNFPLNQNLDIGQTLVSKDTSIVAKISFATTSDTYKAIKYNFNSVLVTKHVFGVGDFSPTDGIYRQLVICYLPKDKDGNVCSNTVYRKSTSDLFNKTAHSEDLGLILYMSNKIPIYRKYISTHEQFKIII